MKDLTPVLSMNDRNRSRIRIIIYILIIAGVVIHSKTAFVESSEVDLTSIYLLIWSVIPYILIFIFRKSLYGSLCAAIIVFIFDLWVHLQVFVFPKSSTAAIDLLIVPLWNLILVIPLSYLIGLMIEKGIEKKKKVSKS